MSEQARGATKKEEGKQDHEQRKELRTMSLRSANLLVFNAFGVQKYQHHIHYCSKSEHTNAGGWVCTVSLQAKIAYG